MSKTISKQEQKGRKSISVSIATYQRLIQKGKFGDTLEDLVVRGIDALDREEAMARSSKA